MAKKDPYKRIQKRFVEARAGDVEYDDLSLEDRERYQNRFNMLSQTVQGRTKIAQRLLPNADPEQRANLKQRIRQNLPSSGSSMSIEDSDNEPPDTPITQRLLPTSADIRNMQSGFRAQGRAIETQRAATKTPTTKTSKATTSDRYGSGFLSVPKSPKKAAVELVGGLDMVGRGLVDYATRGLANPLINLTAQALDKIGGAGPGQKFKPLPVYTNKEIAQDAAITAITAGAGPLLKPFVKPTGTVLKGLAKGLSGRAPGTAAALANIGQSQANKAAVRQAAKLGNAGRRAAMERASVYGMEIPTGKIPDPSGAKFSAPKKTNITISKLDLPPISKQGVSSPLSKTKTKATTKAKTTTPTAITKSNLEQVAEARATSLPPSEKSFDFPGTGPETSAGKSFFEEFGDIEMQSTEYFPSPVRKPPKGGGKPKKPKQPKPKQPNINAPEIPPITKKDIEEATENYAPGFNENFGYIEERSVAPDFPDNFDPSDFGLGSDSNFGEPKIMDYEKFQSEVKRITPIDKVKITEDWVRAGGDGGGGGKIVPKPPKPPKPPKKPKPSSVKEIKQTPKAETPVSQSQEYESLREIPYEIDPMDIEDAKKFPYSKAAREVYAAKRGITRRVGQPKEKLALEPRAKTQPPKIEESISDRLVAAIKAEPKKQTGPDFPIRKVTKLKKVEPYTGQPVTSDQSDSMLFRMYDRGKRPKKASDEFSIGSTIQPLDVDTGTAPRIYSETKISAATPAEVEKEIRETILIPEANIRQGRAVNVRLRKRTKGKSGDMEMPTIASLDAEGEPRMTSFGIPSTETGLSYEQRNAKFYREAFPQARSTREARKLYEQSRGREDVITTIGEYGSIGNPGGPNAPRSPVTTTEVQIPIKFEKTINAKGEVRNKPVAFKTETVKGIWTTSSGKKATPIDDVVEIQYPRVGAEKAEAGRKTRKATKLKSEAGQAARLRNKGIAGEEARSKYDEVVSAKAAGEKFQKSAEEVGRELSALYEDYLSRGLENKTLRPLLPPRPKPNIQSKPKSPKKKKKDKS